MRCDAQADECAERGRGAGAVRPDGVAPKAVGPKGFVIKLGGDGGAKVLHLEGELAEARLDLAAAESEKEMQNACCATDRAKELEGKLAMAEKEYERKLLERKYTAAVQQRAGCHPPAAVSAPTAEETVSA